MKLALALAATVWLAGSACAAGYEEALRASGLIRPAAAAPRGAAVDNQEAFERALWRRETSFADGERIECGGRQGCGKQVSALWMAGRQVTAASRAAEEALIERYGLRGWGRVLLSERDGAGQTALAALAGATLLAADGLHAHTMVCGLRLRVDVAAARRFKSSGAELARVELGPAGEPLALTASWGNRVPQVGAAYRLRY